MHTTAKIPASRRQLAIVAAALILALAPLPAIAFGQSTALIPDQVVDTNAAARSLSEGKEFEEQQRWLDALSHYDDAIREFPDDEQLKKRHTLAEIHCDIERRHADSSYLDFASRVTEQQALESFSEITGKVESHYVEVPRWHQLAWRGTANLYVALSKKSFVDRHLSHSTPEQINGFLALLRDDVNRRVIRSRNDARDLAAYAGRLGSRHLRLEPTLVLLEYCCGAISSLDQYSTYLTSDQLDEVYNQIEGNFVGLGIELKAEDDSLLIVNVIPGGPADQSGIRGGDRIVMVDGHSTDDVSTERAADMLKGVEKSIVRVRILSAQNETRDLAIRRARVEVPCVENTRIIDDQSGIGYFRLTSFQKTTSRDVDAALWELHRQGMKSLIVDVRGNPGGLLTASVEVADKFVHEGTIVSTRGRSPRENYEYPAHRVGTWPIPLIVLIDRDTASASEIFAGAIRDHDRGRIVGEKSYGKGSVQGIFPLSISRAGVRLTTAKFFSPSGHQISKRGVLPNHPVHSAARPIGHELPNNLADDPVLQSAVNLAQMTVAQRQ